MVDSFTLYHFVVSSPTCCSAFGFLNAFTGVFFFFLKMLNFDTLPLEVSGSSSVGSLVSGGGLNFFTLDFPRFQNFNDLLDFFVFSEVDATKYNDMLSTTRSCVMIVRLASLYKKNWASLGDEREGYKFVLFINDSRIK